MARYEKTGQALGIQLCCPRNRQTYVSFVFTLLYDRRFLLRHEPVGHSYRIARPRVARRAKDTPGQIYVFRVHKAFRSPPGVYPNSAINTKNKTKVIYYAAAFQKKTNVRNNSNLLKSFRVGNRSNGRFVPTSPTFHFVSSYESPFTFSIICHVYIAIVVLGYIVLAIGSAVFRVYGSRSGHKKTYSLSPESVDAQNIRLLYRHRRATLIRT